MIYVLSGVLARIISNSYLNVFQKILTIQGNRPSSVNFYMYLGLSAASLLLFPLLNLTYSSALLINFLIMGFLGALGNYFIIKALSLGELSSLAPVNSYKPVVALVIAFLYLNELPAMSDFIGIILIILGTYLLYIIKGSYNSKAVLYRVLALIFSGTEAVFIKKIILLTNISTSFFLWAISGLIFSVLFIINKEKVIKSSSLKYLGLLILSVGIMQYSTNFVFSKINVSSALALFQLSALLSVFLGVNIFKEGNLKRKIIASIIMVAGAVTIIIF